MAKLIKCPYCDLKQHRPELITHIDKVHGDMIPEGYSGSRLVYDIVNNIQNGHGICRVCKSPTKWNESSCKYDILCDNPRCKEALRELYKKNMLRIRGTYNILNDPEQQKKMLAHRRISGIYKHSDGGTIQYTGEYERKFLEFIDTMLNIPSKDIISPGPNIEYTYQGQKHFYLPDFYYIPYNLIIEIKDGGDNPNEKKTIGMISSREKTIEKERIITDKGEYNYLRLTNNQFVQLIDVFMQIKNKLLNGESDSKVIRINESANNTEGVSISKDVFLQGLPNPRLQNGMKNLLNIVDNFKYFIPNGSLKKYTYQSSKNILKTNGGTCIEHVKFLYEGLLSLGLNKNEVTAYWLNGNNLNEYGHTFILLYLGDEYYWLEYAWKKIKGIRYYNTSDDAINNIIERMKKDYGEDNEKEEPITKWFITDYDPSRIPEGINYKQLLDYIHKLPNYRVYKSFNESYDISISDYQDDTIHTDHSLTDKIEEIINPLPKDINDDLQERIENDETVADQDLRDSQA